MSVSSRTGREPSFFSQMCFDKLLVYACGVLTPSWLIHCNVLTREIAKGHLRCERRWCPVRVADQLVEYLARVSFRQRAIVAKLKTHLFGELAIDDLLSPFPALDSIGSTEIYSPAAEETAAREFAAPRHRVAEPAVL